MRLGTSLLTWILILCGTASIAQDSLAIRYASMIQAEKLKEHLYILAGDEFEGRETGKAGQKKAAEYIANHFTDLRIVPSVNGSYFQEFPLRTERINGGSIEFKDTQFEFITDFFFFPGFDASLIEGDVVFGGYGIESELYSDYGDIDVKDKVVLILPGEPTTTEGKYLVTGSDQASEWNDDWRIKRDLAKQKGAKAVIILSDDYDRYVGRIKFWLSSPSMRLDRPREDEAGALPMFFMRKSSLLKLMNTGKLPSLAKLKSAMVSGKKIRRKGLKGEIKITVDRQIDRVTSENVLAFVPGSDPELAHEVLVITAHYDHIGFNEEDVFNGADDDGSGTVSVLELARAFKTAADEGNGPRRSVLLMTVSGEEKGLLGSEWYVNDPVYPLENTVANLNIDMIGRVDVEHANDDNYIYIIGSDRLSTDLHRISEESNETYTGLTLDYTFNAPDDPNRFYYRSDHYNFAKNDIPVIFYFSGVHEDYHGAGDTPDKIMYEKLEKVARLVFHTAWNIANADERPRLDVAQ